MINIKFILVETTHSGNIGASARAIKVMGFDKLCLVNPKCNYKDEQAIAMASNASDILNSISVYRGENAFNQAIADAHINIALTARKRELSPLQINSHELCNFLLSIQENKTVNCNLIFGNEQFGLSNQDVLKCSHILHIQANPQYSSLNLSQAVQIITYELSKISLNFIQDINKITQTTNSDLQANFEQVDGMHNHFMHALAHINFYDENEPQKLPQRLQKLWARSQLTTQEVNILRGIAKNILKLKAV